MKMLNEQKQLIYDLVSKHNERLGMQDPVTDVQLYFKIIDQLLTLDILLSLAHPFCVIVLSYS